MTRRFLYGWDENRNYQVDTEELALEQAAEQLPAADLSQRAVPWTSLLTCYSAERNANPEGQPRIDLNDSDLSRLQSRLLRTVSPTVANFVVAYRQYGPDAGSTAETASPTTAVDLSVPPQHRIASPLDLINARVRVATPGQQTPRIMSSPLADTSSDFRELLLRLLDQTTAIPQPIVPRADQHQSCTRTRVTRRSRPGSKRGRPHSLGPQISGSGVGFPAAHPVWLLFERIVELPQMKALWPYVTCSGQVYRRRLSGFSMARDPWRGPRL